VLDRLGLEKASCECYAIVKERFDAFLTPSSTAVPGHKKPKRPDRKERSVPPLSGFESENVRVVIGLDTRVRQDNAAERAVGSPSYFTVLASKKVYRCAMGRETERDRALAANSAF
jgi:hypothetical protein